jgi:ATP-binding cassette, subfamily C (CFTR/MRP), member 1
MQRVRAWLSERPSATNAAQPQRRVVDIGLLSWNTGWFMNSVISAAVSGSVSEASLVNDEGTTVGACYDTFAAHWQEEVALASKGADKRGQRPSLRRALWRTFRRELLQAAFLKLCWGSFILLSISFFVREILRAINRKTPGSTGPLLGDGAVLQAEHTAYLLSAFFFLNTIVLSLFLQQMAVSSSRVGLRCKAAVATAVYRKTLLHDRHKTHADIMSLVSVDCSKLADSFTTLQYLWSSLVEALAIIGVLLLFTGRAALPGFAVLILVLLPMQYGLGIATSRMRKKTTEASATRVNLMDEILRAIKLVKMYAWEKKFAESVSELREKEESLSRIGGWLKSINMALIFCLPPFVALSIFGIYEIEYDLDGVFAFTTLSMFNTLRLPLVNLPKGLRAASEAMAALERLQRFLLVEDRVERPKTDKVEIVFNSANFAYGSSQEALLKNISVEVTRGKLFMVAGPVGCGKSNLLQAITGNMGLLSGMQRVGGSFAYVPQTPWCAHGTVRDNILFGKPWDEAKYRRVLFACALERDLGLMEHGDLTQIGERGMNLSGGQKQRIALARAAYSDADVYLLDAPLSAVDMYTCVHIFQHTIKDLMVARGGTVVLVTHQVELFVHADILAVMRSGAFAYCGPYAVAAVKEHFPGAGVSEGPPAPAARSTAAPASDLVLAPYGAKPPSTSLALARKQRGRNSYVELAIEMKWYLALISFGIFFFTQFARVYSDIWISRWATRSLGNHLGDAYYVGCYAAYVACFLILLLIRGSFFFFIGIRAASRMHAKMFACVLRAPMAFFTVTPLGHVLSTFARDMDSIDEALLDAIHMFGLLAYILAFTLFVVIRTMNVFAAVGGAVLVVLSYFFCYYIRASSWLKEFCGTTQGAVVAQVSETLQGVDVILAYKAEERFRGRNSGLIDNANLASYNLEMLQLWLCFRLDFLGSVLVFATCLLAIGLKGLTASQAGLAVSNAFQILLFFSVTVKTAADINANISSVNRVVVLSKIESERDVMVGDGVDPGQAWPSRGEVSFQAVVMAYMPGAPNVLKGVDFRIQGGEKVGVAGRTGAGKSTLIMAIFRLAETSEGFVRLDGVDVKTVGLYMLRKRIAIIPQEPVMFCGTLRSNLDPFGERSDAELMQALERCLLGGLTKGDSKCLQMHVAHMGGNFSLGQQQLICLARAMLNSSRLLLLDEATAALDADTDAAVQRVLRANFADRTMVTIAHRLDTIIDSDKILVMDAGRVAEFDSPFNLLNRDSIFGQLCQQTGAQYEALRAAAERHHLATSSVATRAPTAPVAAYLEAPADQGVLAV